MVWTRHRIRYIRIGTIYVIQKDYPDRVEDAVRMFDYYSKAHITLASIFPPDLM